MTASSQIIADRAAPTPTLPFLVSEFDGEILLSLYGRSCRHLTVAQAEAMIAQLRSALAHLRHLESEAVAS